jgi:hypothetical protein
MTLIGQPVKFSTATARKRVDLAGLARTTAGYAASDSGAALP